MTWWPAATKCSTLVDPTYPAPPTTSTFNPRSSASSARGCGSSGRFADLAGQAGRERGRDPRGARRRCLQQLIGSPEAPGRLDPDPWAHAVTEQAGARQGRSGRPAPGAGYDVVGARPLGEVAGAPHELLVERLGLHDHAGGGEGGMGHVDHRK